MIGLIAACDINGIIGYDGNIPWHNKTDFKRFKSLTKGSTVIMGRKTYLSIPPSKKTGERLPGRKKLVLSRSVSEDTDNVTFFSDISDALSASPEGQDIWFIGGRAIYEMAMALGLDVIDLTIININAYEASMDTDKIVYFPNVPFKYRVESEIQNDEDSRLWHRKYVMR